MSEFHVGRLARAVVAAAAVAVTGLSTGVAASAEAAKVRIAMLVADSMLPAMHANEKGYFKDAGIEAELIPIQGGPAIVAAIASGEAEVGYAAVVAAVIAVIVAEMLAGRNGIGFMLFKKAFAIRTAEVFALMFITALMGVVLNRCVAGLRWLVTGWHIRMMERPPMPARSPTTSTSIPASSSATGTRPSARSGGPGERVRRVRLAAGRFRAPDCVF
jgi:hypothetical protein